MTHVGVKTKIILFLFKKEQKQKKRRKKERSYVAMFYIVFRALKN